MIIAHKLSVPKYSDGKKVMLLTQFGWIPALEAEDFLLCAKQNMHASTHIRQHTSTAEDVLIAAWGRLLCARSGLPLQLLCKWKGTAWTLHKFPGSVKIWYVSQRTEILFSFMFHIFGSSLTPGNYLVKVNASALGCH